MGIGRREFLRRFGGILLGLNSACVQAVSLLDNLYLNRKLGLAFEKPAGWVFADVKVMGQVKAGQLLDLEDPELVRLLVEAVDAPILTITKEPIMSKPPVKFTPGINLYLEPDLRTHYPECVFPRDLTQAVGDDLEFCHDVLREFNLLSDPQWTQVSQCPALDYKASFIFEHVLMPKPVRVDMRTLIIFQDPKYYTVRMYDSPYEGARTTFDYTSFIKTIALV